LLRVLDDEGRSDVIFDMNNRSDVPGYGYQLAHGATALTESWQALGGVSNNHFMLGHILEWFYSGLGGIRMEEDGIAMNKIAIRPEPVGNVTGATASYQSPYGLIITNWQKQEKTFTLATTIPANATATIYLPVGSRAVIKESGKALENVTYEGGKAIIKVGSGQYHFTASE
jgi:alpha-L-rhamnosidase